MEGCVNVYLDDLLGIIPLSLYPELSGAIKHCPLGSILDWDSKNQELLAWMQYPMWQIRFQEFWAISYQRIVGLKSEHRTLSSNIKGSRRVYVQKEKMPFSFSIPQNSQWVRKQFSLFFFLFSISHPSNLHLDIWSPNWFTWPYSSVASKQRVPTERNICHRGEFGHQQNSC